MTTTARLFSITSKNTWSGVRFSIIDNHSNVIFESDTRRPVLAVFAYLENGTNFISIHGNRVRLKKSAYLEFNSLVTKHRLGKPLTKEMLCSDKLVMNSGYIDLELGRYVSSNRDICIINSKTLLDVFNTISKETKDEQ